LPNRPVNVLRLLDHRTQKEAEEIVRMGQQVTWPRLEMIRTQTKISRTLDRILADF